MQIFPWLGAALFALSPVPAHAQDEDHDWSIVIHGGAGTISRDRITPQQEKDIRAALDRALDAGSEVLREGGSSLDAVTAAITVLEDDPNFNAGRGAVFTWDETNSLDASIMRGDTLEAGAVAGAAATRNPILLARKVMEASPHVMLSGSDADTFAAEQGLEQVKPSYFFTQHRFDALERHKKRAKRREKTSQIDDDGKYGTVGAVAIDRDGVISAGTSTGGMTGKRWGRIGDSPIIGAGTYANASCGLSATGSGEYFIRLAVAYRVCGALRSAEVAQGAAEDAMTAVTELGGSGGVIYVAQDAERITLGTHYSTPGMYRGAAASSGLRSVAIYDDEPGPQVTICKAGADCAEEAAE